MRKPRFFLYLALALIPFGRLLDLPILESVGKTAPISPIDVTLILAMLTYVWAKASRWQWPGKGIPGFTPMLWFSLWCAASLVLGKIRFGLTLQNAAFSGLYLGRWVAYSSLYLITYEIASSRSSARELIKWVVAGSALFALFGLIQVIFLPSDFALALHPEARAFLDYDPQGRRLVSSLLDPNMAAGFLVIPLLMTVSFYIHGHKRWGPVALLLLIAFVTTLSRGGAIGFLAGFLFLFFVSKSHRKIILQVLGVILVLSLLGSPFLIEWLDSLNKLTFSDNSTYARLYEWGIAFAVIRDNWLTGIGFNTFGYVWPNYGMVKEGTSTFGIENDIIMIMMLTGLIGCALYFWMYRVMLHPLFELGRTSLSSWDAAFGRGVTAATIAAVGCGFFSTAILYTHIMAVLWILWAVGRRIEERSHLELSLLANSAVAAPL
jgi:O-Antigen ligase